jgi:hypothetical protein
MNEVKQIILEDGRKAEKIIEQETDKITTELWVEPLIPKKLEKRVVEFKKPFVHKREIEIIGEDGSIIEKRVESIDPEEKVQLREVVKVEQNNISAQSVGEENYITKDDFDNGIKMVINSLNNKKTETPSYNKVSAMEVMIGDKTKTEDQNNETLSMILCGIIAMLAATLLYNFL